MPKLPWSVTRTQAGALMRFWKEAHSFSLGHIEQEAERHFTLAVVGTDDQAKQLAARLAWETAIPKDRDRAATSVWPYLSVHHDPRTVPAHTPQINAATVTISEEGLAQALAQIVLDYPGLYLSLARHIPAFRPAVTAQLVSQTSWTNAKIAAVSALPGIIPFADILMPATSVGDMLLLTKNQGMMLLRIAAAYGLPVDLRARTRELLPVVGSAFGWRALARELVGLLPGGFGILLKGSVAYAGTYTVGKAAQIYYSTGQTLSGARLRQLGRDASRDVRGRLRQWLRLRKRQSRQRNITENELSGG